ncbi:expressed unknown protein [Seminavis robusta]|uniref:Uncharacterized protein n=1 Tax=Seminavis robusta TaxID=568900 RepID=A0A9N8HAD1_9STRA|nr:expressed unknown protein [Seminavis robusta]|eukprot:Sro143_g066820.1 n/a (268) ;mRNA; f:105889-106692
MLRPLLFTYLFFYLPIVSAQQQCPLCYGGDAAANLNNTIGGAADGVTCGEFLNDVELDSDDCLNLQLVAYRYCGCPRYPEEFYCPMCKDSFVNIPNKFKTIPGTEKTCDEKLFVKSSEMPSNGCSDAMKPGYVCGCPDAEEPFCQICGGSVEDDTKIRNPEATLTINGVGVKTCQQIANEALLGSLSIEQCSLVQAEAFTTCGCEGSEELEANAPTSDASSKNNATDVPLETDAATPSPTEEDNSAATISNYFWASLLGVVAMWLIL